MRRPLLRALEELDARLQRAGSLLIATDFDGTLCPLVERPAAAAMAPVMAATLADLSASPRVTLAVLSGRGLDDLARRVPMPVVLGGNHGFEIRGPGIEFRHPEAVRLRPALAAAKCNLARAVAAFPGAWVEDKCLTVTVHYRQVHAYQQRNVVLAVRQSMAAYGTAFGMRAGKKAIEIYPRCNWHKGSALGWIRRTLGLEEALCICAGDDRTDECMFQANPEGINIHVGSPHADSAAQYSVGDAVEMLVVLARIQGARRYSAASAPALPATSR